MAYQYVTRDGKRVEVHVASAFDKMATAFKAKFGLTLNVTDGTRTRAEQAALYKTYQNGGQLAAAPGYSNHEEDGPIGPVALDLHDSGKDNGVTVAGTTRANWLESNCGTYGFKPAGYSFSEIEPWHYEYTGKIGGSSTPAPAPAPAKASNPFGISDVRGLQKIAKLNGGNTATDNIWGAQSAKGFAQFLRANYGYSGNDVLGPVMWASIARWLRARWGYVGNDVPGPVMRAALTRANKANWEQL